LPDVGLFAVVHVIVVSPPTATFQAMYVETDVPVIEIAAVEPTFHGFAPPLVPMLSVTVRAPVFLSPARQTTSTLPATAALIEKVSMFVVAEVREF
jgi:hypothetical protein